MTNSPRRPAARQSTQSIASLAHLRQPSQIRRRGLADRKHAVAADNRQRAAHAVNHATRNRPHAPHGTQQTTRATIAAAAPRRIRGPPRAKVRVARPTTQRAHTYSRREGGAGGADPSHDMHSGPSFSSKKFVPSCESRRRCGPSRGADVGRVAAQMWAESRRRSATAMGQDMQQCDGHKRRALSRSAVRQACMPAASPAGQRHTHTCDARNGMYSMIARRTRHCLSSAIGVRAPSQNPLALEGRAGGTPFALPAHTSAGTRAHARRCAEGAGDGRTAVCLQARRSLGAETAREARSLAATQRAIALEARALAMGCRCTRTARTRRVLLPRALRAHACLCVRAHERVCLRAGLGCARACQRSCVFARAHVRRSTDDLVDAVEF